MSNERMAFVSTNNDDHFWWLTLELKGGKCIELNVRSAGGESASYVSFNEVDDEYDAEIQGYRGDDFLVVEVDDPAAVLTALKDACLKRVVT